MPTPNLNPLELTGFIAEDVLWFISRLRTSGRTRETKHVKKEKHGKLTRIATVLYLCRIKCGNTSIEIM